MNQVYPSAVNSFLVGAIDISSDTIRCELLDGAEYDADNVVLSDLDPSTRFEAPATVLFASISGGAVFIDPVVFPPIPTGNTINALAFYIEGVDEDSSPLLCYIDRAADTVPLAIETNDGPVTFTFGRLFKL